MPYLQSGRPTGGANPSGGYVTSTSYDPTEDFSKTLSGYTGRKMTQPLDMEMLRQQQAPEMAKLNMQQAHWGALFPYLQRALGGVGGFGSQVGGRSGAGPRISSGPIWDQNQQQQKVNSIRAQGAQETAGQQQTMQDRLAGSGFGAHSPLAAALASQMGMANQASTANQVREFGQNAAQQNAAQVMKGQTAREGQYASRMQEDIERRRVASGYQTGLLGLLGQFI